MADYRQDIPECVDRLNSLGGGARSEGTSARNLTLDGTDLDSQGSGEAAVIA